MLAGSKEHFYRLSLGAIPFGRWLLSLERPNQTRRPKSNSSLQSSNGPPGESDDRQPGEIDVPIDANHFRTRKKFKVIVGPGREIVEQEPNDAPAQANPIALPSVVNGRFGLRIKPRMPISIDSKPNPGKTGFSKPRRPARFSGRYEA